MTKQIFYLMCVLSFLACNRKKSKIIEQPTVQVIQKDTGNTPRPEIIPMTPTKAEKPAPFVVASFKKTPCFGRCPTFEATIYSDGKVIYNGLRYVERIGVFETQANLAQVEELIKKAESMQFFDLKPKYPSSGEEITDLPLTITSIKKGENLFKIENQYNAPLNLQKFESFFEEWIEQLNWMKAKD